MWRSFLLEFELSYDGTYYTLAGCKTEQTEVIIPGTYKGLPVDLCSSLFNCDKTIESVVIEEGVEVIPSRCFSYASNLVSVTLPNSVVRIEENAFEYCKKLESITIPSKLEYIGKYAFANAFNSEYTGQINIVLPNTVKEIGSYAFWYSNITGITLPTGLKTIEYGLFYNAYKISSIVIPDTVEKIMDQAFTGMQIDYIILPKSVKYIGENAVRYMKGKKVYYLGSLEDYEAVDDTKANVGYQLYVHDSTKATTAHGHFWYYDEDENIVEIVNDHNFVDGKCACGEYEDYVLKVLDGKAIFCRLSDSNSSSAVVPAEYKGYPVSVISNSAFYNNTYLSSVTLPSTITTIEANAFSSCSALKTLVLPDGLVSIGRYAFANSGITSLVIPETVTYIAEFGLADITMESITLPSKIERLEPNTFYQSTVNSVVLPKSLVYIAQNAVYNLTALYFLGTAEEFAKIDYVPYSKGPTVYYFSETTPKEAGNYWHYVDGVPTIYAE